MEVPYSSPIDISKYPIISVFFLVSGFVATCIFFVYQVHIKKAGASNLAVELAIGLIASIMLGIGSFFGVMVFDLFV